MKKSKKDEPKQPKKVFDVMRPGKTAAQATSRPVIVGHKPQVKDPMMSDRTDTEQLMDSKKKIALQPTNTSETSTSTTTPEITEPVQPIKAEPDTAETQKPHDGPYVADEIASLATTNAIEKVPEGAENTQQLATPLDAPKAPETNVIPTESPVPAVAEEAPKPVDEKQPEQQTDTPPPSPATDARTSGTTGVVFDEVPDFETLTAAKPDPNASVEPLPKLPDTPEEKAVVQMPKVVVSHHNHSNGWAKFFLTFLILAVIAVVVIDVLLDSGLLVKDGLPHTNFFQ